MTRRTFIAETIETAAANRPGGTVAPCDAPVVRQHPVLDLPHARVRIVRLRVRDVRRPGRDDVDRGVGGDAVARLHRRDHDRALRHDRPQPVDEARRERVGSLRTRGLQCHDAVDEDRQGETARPQPRRAPWRSRTVAAARRADDERREPAEQRDPRRERRARRAAGRSSKSPGQRRCSTMPATSAAAARARSGRAARARRRARTSAARTRRSRRDCESETASEKCTNSHGTSISSRIASAPTERERRPAAPQRRAPASGSSTSARDGDRAAAAEHLGRETEVMRRS